MKKVCHLDGATAAMTWHTSLKDVPEKYSARFCFIWHRDDHAGLCRLLETTEGLPVKVSLETAIEAVDCKKGTIQTKDGRLVKKDLVVANRVNVSPFLFHGGWCRVT